MTPTKRLKVLKIVLLVFGAFFVVGVYPLTIFGHPVLHGTRVTRSTW